MKHYQDINTGVYYRDGHHKGRRVLVELNDSDYYLPLTTEELRLLDLNGELHIDWGDLNIRVVSKKEAEENKYKIVLDFLN